MALSVTHTFVSAIPDSGVAGLVKPSHWNAVHTVSGNLPVSQLNSGTGASIASFWRGDGVWKRAAPPYYNVMDYGAVGDNSTDDTAALNALFTSLIGQSGTIIFPPGTYKITDSVVIGQATGGAGAPTTFLSVFCPGGPNNTVLNYSGPTDGRAAFQFAKNKYFFCHGINVSMNGAKGSSVGMRLGGSGSGAFGNQVLGCYFSNCFINAFHIGITDGNFGACSEVLWIDCTINGCDTGWVMNDFNSLDHQFLDIGLTANAIGIDTGAVENAWVDGGSSTSNGVDFNANANSTNMVIKNFRSENAGASVRGQGGSVFIRDCLFKGPLNGASGNSLPYQAPCVTGQFGNFSMYGSRLEGYVTFTYVSGTLTMVDCIVAGNPQTGLPFSVQQASVNHGTAHVFCKNNHDGKASPPVAISDYDGFLKDLESPPSAPFRGVQVSNLLSVVRQEVVNANVGSPYAFDYLALSGVRQLAEGPISGVGTPFTTTAVTNAPTASGNILHFASVPAAVQPGMYVTDSTTGGVIPSSTFVTAYDTGVVSLSNSVTGGGVLNGDTITFNSLTGVPVPGNNLRIMGQFATSGTLALGFTRNVTMHTGGGQGSIFTATTGIFFLSDVGKPVKIAGQGNSGWTDWYGAVLSYTDSTHATIEAADQQAPSISAPGSVAVIGTNEPDGNYMVLVTGNANETFWVTNIISTGFTIHSSNASSTAIVTCLILR